MAYKIWLFLWYFVLASFCGWVAEVGYIGMVYRKFKNPGMLNGPYCPQYGLMIALPWAALTALHWQTSFVATLFFCLISSFLVEFTFAWLLRKTTHIRLRDYSKFKWNIKGYVSVPVATVRGVCFSFIVVFIVPVLTSLLHYVNRTVGWVILYAVLGIMLLDIIITSITVQRLNHQFKRLSELGDRVREARNALGNAVTGGAIIPMLALAVPGDGTTAVLMSAFIIKGIDLGPMIFSQHPEVVNTTYIFLILGNIFMLILGLSLAKIFAKVIEVDNKILLPVVLLICMVGTFASASNTFNIYVMIFFGILGFVMQRFKFSLTPMILGLVLGSMAEENFRSALTMSQGDYSVFFRPISLVFIIIAAVILAWPRVRRLLNKRKAGKSGTEA